jgi:cytochrome c biogenesis protein CcmG/thiol:disulfide interchange protein DsbE
MRVTFLIPVGVFVVLTGLLAYGLYSGDPKEIPSVFINEPAPELSLDPIAGYREAEGGLSNEILREGHVSIINVWASWCIPCRLEHDALMHISKTVDVPLYGLNYKDRSDRAVGFLEELGDPYTRIGADEDGRAGIDWGVYGVPETFIVDGQGNIIYKHVGPIDGNSLTNDILPALAKAAESSSPAAP